ncbi:MAG: hypothetical protein C0402_15325 [Thermodesulfovibrio sp.]|nr:hypothetical protein [Thermodesulfovibrio sp.]
MITRFAGIQVLLAATLFLLLQGLSYGGAAGNSWKLSSSQRQYIKTYGSPQQFILLYDLPEGNVSAAPRRIESWIYLSAARFVLFDNGFFSEEQPTGVKVPKLSEAPHTRLKPERFHSSMTQKDIIRTFGKPDTTETAAFGSHTYTILRYLSKARKPGVLNISLYDGKLAGVVAGFAIQPADMDTLRKDLQGRMP